MGDKEPVPVGLRRQESLFQIVFVMLLHYQSMLSRGVILGLMSR